MKVPAQEKTGLRSTLGLGLAGVAWVAFWVLLNRLPLSDGMAKGLLLTVVVLLGCLGWMFPRANTWLVAAPWAAVQLALLGAWGLGALWGAPGGRSAGLAVWGLLGGMGVALGLVLVARWRPRWSRVGFLVAHGGALLLLLGGLWNGLMGWQGQVPLVAGETLRSFPTVGGVQELPFGVRFEGAVAVPGPSKPALRLHWKAPGVAEPSSRTLNLKPGESLRLPFGGPIIRMDSWLPSAFETGGWVQDPAAPENPALRVLLGLGSEEMPTGLLFARGERSARREEPLGRFALAYRDRLDPTALRQMVPRPPTAECIEVHRAGTILRHDLGQGRVFQGVDYRLTIQDRYPDFAIEHVAGRPVPGSRSQEPRDPWVQVLFEPKDAPAATALISARRPEISDPLNAPHLPPGVRLRYVREGEETQGCWVVFVREGQRVVLVEHGAIQRTEPWVLHRPFVVAKGLSVTPLETLDRAVYQRSFLPDPEARGGQRVRPPATKLEVMDAGGNNRKNLWISGGDSLASIQWDQGETLGFSLQETGAGETLKTEVVVQDAQGAEVRREPLSSSDLLRHHGHHFRLRREGSAWRVEGCHRPGDLLVRLGWVAMLLGSAWMVFLKPTLKAREVKP